MLSPFLCQMAGLVLIDWLIRKMNFLSFELQIFFVSCLSFYFVLCVFFFFSFFGGVCAYLIFTVALWRYHYYPRFTDYKTEAQAGWINLSKIARLVNSGAVWQPRSGSRIHVLNLYCSKGPDFKPLGCLEKRHTYLHLYYFLMLQKFLKHVVKIRINK